MENPGKIGITSENSRASMDRRVRVAPMMDYTDSHALRLFIIVRSNGTVTLETIGRGKAALRWLERLQGKKLMQVVGR